MGQLGETLRERRIALGVSMETAEADTKIRARLLEALEQGDYGKLPNPGYVRGYVSSYARYLELDPVPMLAMYRAETGAGRYHDINLPDEQAVAPRNQQHAIPWRVAIIAFTIVALLALGSCVAWRIVKGPTKPPPIPNSPSQGTAPATTAPPFALRVAVGANGASALRVTVDGSQAYAGTLAGGQSKDFQVTKSAVLKIGKPAQVSVTRDGKPVAVPAGSNVTLTLNAAQP